MSSLRRIWRTGKLCRPIWSSLFPTSASHTSMRMSRSMSPPHSLRDAADAAATAASARAPAGAAVDPGGPGVQWEPPFSATRLDPSAMLLRSSVRTGAHRHRTGDGRSKTHCRGRDGAPPLLMLFRLDGRVVAASRRGGAGRGLTPAD
jgi:hypothetical protein